MVELEQGILDRVFATTRGVQHRYDSTQKPEKLEAKRRAAALINRHVPGGGELLDVGGEEFYHQNLPAFKITTHNLPDLDMHSMAYVARFDAVLAMHVLEHSPFPLLVLQLIERALKPGGSLYIAVPEPCKKFCTKFGHWSVMPASMWGTLIKGAGLEVVFYERGKFGPKKLWWEYRFVCRKAAA